MLWTVNKRPSDPWYEALIIHTDGQTVRRCFFEKEQAIAWARARVARGERKHRFAGLT